MKSFALLAVGAGVAMAQQLSDLPTCGQTCINNMVAIATSEFGCSNGDIACYCGRADFGYGVRDCTNESCPQQDQASVLAYGNNYCASAVASAGPSAASSGAAILSSAAGSATATAGGATQGSAISTQPLVATITSDGSTILSTTGFSTIYGSLTGSAASAASSVAESASSVLASATDSAGSAISSAAASASDAASSVEASVSSKLASATGSGSGSGSATGSAGAPSSSGAAPRMTALPLAGAAGMAAWLFL